MTYDESWDRPHRPGANPLWQESDCYWFYDAAKGVGGFHRIGQTPAKGIGQVMLFVFDEGGEGFVRPIASRAVPGTDVLGPAPNRGHR